MVDKIDLQICGTLKWYRTYKKRTCWDGPYHITIWKEVIKSAQAITIVIYKGGLILESIRVIKSSC